MSALAPALALATEQQHLPATKSKRPMFYSTIGPTTGMLESSEEPRGIHRLWALDDEQARR